MSLEQILDRLERMHKHITSPNSSDEMRVYHTEAMIDALIAHIKDAMNRDPQRTTR